MQTFSYLTCGMKKKDSHLISVLLGARVLTQVAQTQGCNVAALRVLALVHVLAADARKVTARGCATWLDCHYLTALAGANECVERGWLERQQTKGWGLRATLDGLSMAAKIERTEREARMRIVRAELPRWPRRYRAPGVAKKLAS